MLPLVPSSEENQVARGRLRDYLSNMVSDAGERTELQKKRSDLPMVHNESWLSQNYSSCPMGLW